MSIMSYLKDRNIYTLIIVVIALAALDGYTVIHGGIHLGIEFAGGTQIPITLEHGVNSTEMQAIISTLEQRVSTFGLRQVTVEGIGNSTIYVTVPTVSPVEINQTIDIIESQGNFQGIVQGVEAVNGTGILHGSVQGAAPQPVNKTYEWLVSFYLTDSAADHFAAAALGKANLPLYLFLDRPTGAIVLINGSELNQTTQAGSTTQISGATALEDAQSALQLGNMTIPVLAVYNTSFSIQNAGQFLNGSRAKYSTVIASSNLDQSFLSQIRSGAFGNYTLELKDSKNMTPTVTQLTINTSYVDSWPAMGLLSAPILNPGVTNGNVSDTYEISGAAPAGLSQVQQYNNAQNQSKTISSILTGGALPVAVIVGTPTVIPPTLGSNFLKVSILALLLAVLAISIFVVLIYKKIFLVAPILITTFIELFIIFSIIGVVGTIDLSAVAGMIAIVGTGIDSQIIITDEMLSKHSHQSSAKTILGNAFYIVWTDALLLVIAMLPLFFSTSLVDVIGFSEATIIGALLGVLITRPAYGAIIGRHYG
jgi:preprotein translocase subunit SecD